MAKLFSKNRDTDTTERVLAAYTNTKGTAQDLLNRAQGTARSTAANVKGMAQNTLTSAKGMTQDQAAKAKDLAHSTFDTTRNVVQDRLAKAQELMAIVASIVAALLYENQHKVQEKLKQAQVSLLKTATPIAEKTQNVVVTSTKKASKSLQQVADNAKDIREALQDGYAHYQRKRRRKRIFFRIGVLAGVALALFYTPLAGSDVRQRIAQQWQRCRSYFRR